MYARRKKLGMKRWTVTANVDLANAPQPATGSCASDGLNAKYLCYSRMDFKSEDRSAYTRPAKSWKTKKKPSTDIATRRDARPYAMRNQENVAKTAKQRKGKR